jgi:hypothetical protein
LDQRKKKHKEGADNYIMKGFIFMLLNKFHYGNQIRKNKVDGILESTEELRNSHKILIGKPNHLGEISLHARIILKWLFAN